jgi:hypothetical protein
VDRLARQVSAAVAPEAESAERLAHMEAMLETLLWNHRDCGCVLRERPHDVHLLTGPHRARVEGAETLEEFVEGARSLVVADPYFYSYVHCCPAKEALRARNLQCIIDLRAVQGGNDLNCELL